MLSEHSDTTPLDPSHSPSATKQGLPQLPNKRIILSQLHIEWFPPKASRLMLYCITITSPVHHLGLLTFLSTFQPSNFCPETWEWVQNKDYTAKELRETLTVEPPYWSAWASTPQQWVPPLSTLWKSHTKKTKTKPKAFCLAQNHYMKHRKKTQNKTQSILLSTQPPHETEKLLTAETYTSDSRFPKLQLLCSPVLLSVLAITSTLK